MSNYEVAVRVRRPRCPGLGEQVITESQDRIAADEEINDRLDQIEVGSGYNIVSVSGEDDLLSEDYNGRLTFVAGSNITITTNTGTGEVTIEADGGNNIDGGSA